MEWGGENTVRNIVVENLNWQIRLCIHAQACSFAFERPWTRADTYGTRVSKSYASHADCETALLLPSLGGRYPHQEPGRGAEHHHEDRVLHPQDHEDRVATDTREYRASRRPLCKPLRPFRRMPNTYITIPARE